MSLYDLITHPETKQVIDWAFGFFLSGTTLIQLLPIRINPWDSILNWVGCRLTKDLSNDVKELHNSFEEMWIAEHRHRILTFARECRRGVDHSLEEWHFVISVMEEYENYCRRNKVDNGVVKEDSRYIRDIYQELSREHKL